MPLSFRAIALLLAILIGECLRGPTPANSAPPADDAKSKEPQFYTVQIGSYTDEEEAIDWYNRLAAQLPADQKEFLRIETINDFHAVRVGKAENRQDLVPIITEAQRVSQKPPAIIRGYYLPQRITKIFAAGKQGEAAATPPPPTTPDAPGSDKPTPPPAKPEAKAATAAEAHEEPLDTPPTDSKVAAKGKGARQADKSAKPPIKPSSPVPPPTPIPDATLKQLIVDKYLTNQEASHTNKDAIVKQSQTFPESPSCVTDSCHPGLKSSKAPHYPTQTGRCLACHQQVNQQHPDAPGPDFQLAAKGAELCNRCHVKFEEKAYRHEPAAKGECLQCHDPHGTDNPFLLQVTADNQEQLCAKCHDKQENKFTHGPVGLGACTFCHAAHVSDTKSLLKNDPQTLCFECHADIAKGVKESVSVHEVVRTEGCLSCHQPHGGEFPYLLKQGGEKFCFTCHADIEEKYTKSRSKHAGLYLDKQCGTCHQPHYSPYAKLLNNRELDLCLGCHSDKNPVRTKSPKNIAIELKKTYLHDPLAKGECSGCHDPHGSKYLKLLSGPYPDTFYAPYDPEIYDLCFTCHDKDLLTAQTTDTATDFRNGSQNLHYLHATIPRKGRTCQTCHQPHSSDGPKLINQTGSAFGEWQMSISFSLKGSGGSCMPGCHRKMGYNREKAVDNSVKETEFGQYHVEYESAK